MREDNRESYVMNLIFWKFSLNVSSVMKLRVFKCAVHVACTDKHIHICFWLENVLEADNLQ